MKSFNARLLALGALPFFASALQILPKTEKPSVARFGLEAKAASSSTPTGALTGEFNGVFYALNISIGTPAQNVSVVFDTGSRDLFINYAQSDFCSQGACTDGVYDPSLSSSAQFFADKAEVSYELVSGSGSWFTDNIQIGDNTLKDYQFGLLNTSTGSQTYWGMGYPETEPSGATNPVNTTLRNMANSGFIKSASVGILLKDGGEVIFGGVDTAAYLGDLTVLPMVPSSSNGYDRVAVNLSSVTAMWATDSGTTDRLLSAGDDEFPARVLLDTGNFDIKLPPSYATTLWDMVGIKGVNITGPNGNITYGLCACTLAQANMTVNFTLGSLNVSVPAASFVFDIPPAVIQSLSGLTLPEGTCVFGINPLYSLGAFDYILGAAFLKNVYFVIDQDNHEVGFAPLNPSPGAPSIQEIAAGADLSDMSDSSSGNNSSSSSPSGSTGSNPSSTTSGTASPSKTGAASRQQAVSAVLAVVLGGAVAMLA